MSYYLWSFLNIILIGFIYIAIIYFEPSRYSIFTLAKSTAIIANILFLINLSMYFIFRTIKKAKTKKVKIFFVKLSRRIFKLHIYLAITGAGLILIHSTLMLLNIINSLSAFLDLNIITGILAVILLLSTLTTGYIRYRRATGRRRKNHLIAASIFAVVFILHIIL